ncbi:MAG: response regulator [Chlamydiales bacterium]|nr:response regulator [Chlamydiales bacterium]
MTDPIKGSSKLPQPTEEKTVFQPRDIQQNVRVLQVEDTKYIRDATKSFVEEIQWIYTGAPTGEEALRIYDPKAFDVIIMDIHLGKGMDGYETTRRIRAINPHQLIYSCSSNPVDNSTNLFNGDIPKQGIRNALRGKILVALSEKKA